MYNANVTPNNTPQLCFQANASVFKPEFTTDKCVEWNASKQKQIRSRQTYHTSGVFLLTGLKGRDVTQ